MIDARRWGILLLTLAVCAGLAGWFAWGKKEPAPTVPASMPAAPVKAKSLPLDLSAPAPEVRTATVASDSTRPIRGLAILGRTVDTAGAPIPDAVVQVYEVNAGPHQVFSDTSGNYVVDQLPMAEYRVSAQKEHYNDALVEKVRPSSEPVVLVMTVPSRVPGRVMDESEAPITDFEVVYLKQPEMQEALWKEIVRSPRTAWQVYSDPEGRFELPDVASGAPFAVGARAEGFEPGYVTVAVAEPGQASEPAEIRLKPEAKVEGTVLSPERQPVAGATVHLGKDIEGLQVAETDPDGRFELKGLGEAAFELTANHDLYLPATVQVIPKRSEAVSVEIVMGLGGNIEGLVTKGSAPAAGQTVAVSRLTPPRIRKQVVTGPDGRYAVAGIGTGLVDVLAKYREPNSEGGPLRLHRQAEILPGQVTQVDFQFADSYAVLEGTVLANGEPAEFAEIKGTVTNADGQTFLSTTVGEDGHYRIENVMPGSAWMEVTARVGEAELRKNVAVEIPGEGTVRRDVNFEPASGITGTVQGLRPGEVGQVMAFVSETQLDISTLESVIELERISTGQCDIGDDGSFRIGGLEPGTYTLLALVFQGEADTGDTALNSIRTGRQVVTLKAAGEVQASITIGS